MGVTLDELLENSGINSLKEEETEKTASDDAQVDGKDIIAELLKHANEKPAKSPALKEEAARELAEKTAEIFIIKQTMQEIDKLASLGVDSNNHQKVATFIKVAMDKGHNEHEIAAFLEKTAKGGRIGRAIGYAAQSLRRGRAQKHVAKALRSESKERELLRRTLTGAKPGEIANRLKRLEGKIGRPALEEHLQAIKAEGTYIPRIATGYLPRGTKVTVKGPSGAEKTISTRTLKRYGIPAAAGGAGLVMGSRGKDQKGGRGVTIVS